MDRVRAFFRSSKAMYVLLGVLGTIAANIIRGWLADSTFNSVSLLGLITVIVLMVALTQLTVLRSDLTALSAKSGFSIRWYGAGNDQEAEELHRAASAVIRTAPANAVIYAVNSYVEVAKSAHEDDAVYSSQRNYLRDYESRFGKVPYHRLIQIPSSGHPKAEQPLATLLTKAYLEHYRLMVRHASGGRGARVKLEEVEASIPTSFVVVEHGGGGEIIWQINRHSGRTNSNNGSTSSFDTMEMLGIFVIRDPHGEVVSTFRKWFEIIDRGQPTIVTHEDLQEPSVAAGASAESDDGHQ